MKKRGSPLSGDCRRLHHGEAQSMAVPVVKSIVARLEPYVCGIDAASMEEAFVRRLHKDR